MRLKRMTLRQLPVGTRFYLVRTMAKYTLISAAPSPFGGYQYTVRRDGAEHTATLHHSCHVKPIVLEVPAC